jgi:hypothetical protein
MFFSHNKSASAILATKQRSKQDGNAALEKMDNRQLNFPHDVE